MTRNTRTLVAVALPILALALTHTAEAQSFSGNWPLTITHSPHGNGTYCLGLTDDGSLGFPHSGQAVFTGQTLGGEKLFGTFQVINGLLTATIQSQGGTGQNAGLVFVAHAAKKGTLGKGVYDEVYGGEEFNSGALAFGAKGGC